MCRWTPYPNPSLEFMIRDSRARILVTTQDVAEQLSVEGCDVLCIDSAEIAAAPSVNLPDTSEPDLPAYIIYTSGSTGTPRGGKSPTGVSRTWSAGINASIRRIQRSGYRWPASRSTHRCGSSGHT